MTVAEIANAAGVAVSTVFKHPESTEAIAFASNPVVESELRRVAVERSAGTWTCAHRAPFSSMPSELVAGSQEFVDFLRRTPALTAYSLMRSRHTHPVARAIEAEHG